MGLSSLVGTFDAALVEFASSVGSDDPVCVVGGRTQWDLGGPPSPGTREVVAPSGVVAHEPAEMVVRVRAGTTVAELSSVLARSAQMVPLDASLMDRATVGGVLAAGQSGLRRLRYGPVRDTVLEAHFVSSAGRVIKAGGPVVKNVSGFDLCRLLVGSLGTLGLIGEVVLRCHPVPARSSWYRVADADPFGLATRLYRPSTILTNGADTWVLLEGDPDDVADQASSILGAAAASSPVLPALGGTRLSLTAAELGQLARSSPGSSWWAEVGVGTVHTDEPSLVAAAAGVAWPPVVAPAVASLNQAVKSRFDPQGRLNPGRRVP